MEMVYEKVRQNGEARIPEKALKAIGVNIGKRIAIRIENGEINITPASNLSHLRGILKGKIKGSSIKIIREIRNEETQFDI